MDLLTVDGELRTALLGADFGPHLQACAYRILDETDGEYLAEAVLIIDRNEWDEVASQACRAAREEANRVLANTSVLVILVCRTKTEHAQASAYEVGIWTPVSSSVSCV
jgi:hypothetical protein